MGIAQSFDTTDFHVEALTNQVPCDAGKGLVVAIYWALKKIRFAWSFRACSRISAPRTTSGGRLVFHIFGILVEFERNLIQERTRAALAVTRARERKGGRSEALDEKKTQLLYQLNDERKHILKEICDILDISRSSLYVYLHRREETMGGFQKVEQP